MTLRFTETAPGVHTTSLLNPKTKKTHNIAIIESCNAWHLFIDGEASDRDLPSLKAAASAAQAKILSQRSPVMVRAACILVVASIAGASMIGATKLLGPGTETAVAAGHPLETHATPASAPKFERVKPVPTNQAPSSAPNQPASRTANLTAKTPAEPASALVNATSNTTSASAPPAAGIRRFSAENPALAASSKPIIKTNEITNERAIEEKKDAAPRNDTVRLGSEPSSTIARTKSPVAPLTELPTYTTTVASSIQTTAPTATTELASFVSAPLGEEASGSPSSQFESDAALPVLPTKAPQTAVSAKTQEAAKPVIRSSRPAIPASLLAEIARAEADDNASGLGQTEAPTTRPNTSSSRSLSSARIGDRRQRVQREHRKLIQKRAHRSRTRNTERRASSRIAGHEGPSQRHVQHQARMVCFAHSCKFR